MTNFTIKKLEKKVKCLDHKSKMVFFSFILLSSKLYSRNNNKFYGALTNKIYSFEVRSWDIKQFSFFDTLYLECVPIQLHYKYLDVVRVEPTTQNLWITDKTRHAFVKNFKLIKPLKLMISSDFFSLKVGWLKIFEFVSYIISVSRAYLIHSTVLSRLNYYVKNPLNISTLPSLEVGKFIDNKSIFLLQSTIEFLFGGFQTVLLGGTDHTYSDIINPLSNFDINNGSLRVIDSLSSLFNYLPYFCLNIAENSGLIKVVKSVSIGDYFLSLYKNMVFKNYNFFTNLINLLSIFSFFLFRYEQGSLIFGKINEAMEVILGTKNVFSALSISYFDNITLPKKGTHSSFSVDLYGVMTLFNPFFYSNISSFSGGSLVINNLMDWGSLPAKRNFLIGDLSLNFVTKYLNTVPGFDLEHLDFDCRGFDITFPTSSILEREVSLTSFSSGVVYNQSAGQVRFSPRFSKSFSFVWGCISRLNFFDVFLEKPFLKI